VKVLRLPEQVTGYREIRYPKMAFAREQAERWLSERAGARGEKDSRAAPVPDRKEIVAA
jgi:hypothetical protein